MEWTGERKHTFRLYTAGAKDCATAVFVLAAVAVALHARVYIDEDKYSGGIRPILRIMAAMAAVQWSGGRRK